MKLTAEESVLGLLEETIEEHDHVHWFFRFEWIVVCPSCGEETIHYKHECNPAICTGCGSYLPEIEI